MTSKWIKLQNDMYACKCFGKVHSNMLSEVSSGKWDWRVIVSVTMLSISMKENPNSEIQTIRILINLCNKKSLGKGTLGLINSVAQDSIGDPGSSIFLLCHSLWVGFVVWQLLSRGRGAVVSGGTSKEVISLAKKAKVTASQSPVRIVPCLPEISLS